MKKFLLIFYCVLFLLPTVLFNPLSAQNQVDSLTQEVNSLQVETDTLVKEVTTLKDVVAGVEEKLATAQSDLAKLTKLKISGYLQTQWQQFEASSVYPNNTFLIRRARIKFTYEPVNGIVFVIQPDFVPGNITVKDAYAVANEKWLKTFSLWMGKFNRPDYEVEYSSSNREVPERSRYIRAIYPDERGIGMKLEIHPPNLPLKVQLALFNGNEGIAINQPVYNYATNKWDQVLVSLQNPDYDDHKDFMGRVTYGFKFGNLGGITVGANGYYGAIKANSKDVLNSDYTYNESLENIGNVVPKQWIGFETQLYLDILGGLAVKAECAFGKNSNPGYYTSVKGVVLPVTDKISNDTLFLTNTTLNSYNYAPAITRNFMGYYVYLIKNIGKKNQVAVRYDYYDPNTKLSGSEIGTANYNANIPDVVTNNYSYAGNIVNNNQVKTTTVNKLTSGLADMAYGTWTMAYTYFFDEYIKFMIAYEIPINEKVGTVTDGIGNVKTDYTVNGVSGTYYWNNVIAQNVLTLRLQVKF